MPLNPTQREFLITQLKVKPRAKGPRAWLPTARTDKAIVGNLDEYLGREAEILKALNRLRSVPATEDMQAELEKDLAEVQREVAATQRKGGATSLGQAYARLDEKFRAQQALQKLIARYPQDQRRGDAEKLLGQLR